MRLGSSDQVNQDFYYKPELDLSVVIIGKNEEKYLGRCIESVQKAGIISKLSFEIIYVDSASTDNSVKIASQFPIHVISVYPESHKLL
jgi:glycosyltransferase involved in cell wall biosynthesis